uniref:AIG1-type G domain-containing protein n=1 Tax=Scophthalmus maximus TaxID=52904 RepID=A0A8D3AU37_SCOMX
MTHHLPLLLVSLRSFLPNRECYLDLFSSLHLLSAMSEHPRGSSYHGSSTPELRLVLLGNLGCGKTSSADTILGQLSRVSPAAARSCQQRQNIIEGRSVTLVEAPRWYWSGGRMEDSVRKETERAMTLVAPGPHAILLLVPVCQFTEVAISNFFSSFARLLLLPFLSNLCCLFFLIPPILLPLLNNHIPLILLIIHIPLIHIPIILIIIIYIPLILLIIHIPSAAGNSILGQEAFQSHSDSLTSITLECEKKKALVEGRRVAVVDTPDWFNSERAPEEVRAQISSCVALSSPGPHAFLLCVPLDQPAKTELQALRALETVFGPEAVQRHALVLFTYADRLRASGKAGNESVEAYIAGQRGDLLNLVEKCRDRFHVMESGGGETERRSVAELLEKVEQTVKEAGGQCYSSPAFQEAENRVRQRQVEIAREKRGTNQEQYVYKELNKVQSIFVLNWYHENV